MMMMILIIYKVCQCDNAADAVFSTPHSCLTTPCPTHCSPAHANVCPIRKHSDNFI